MRSTCSGVASRSCTIRSASSENGRLQRLTRKPGPSAASITCLPIASPVARAVASAVGRLSSPATTSTSCITGRRVEEVHADHALRAGHAGAIAVTLSDDVLVASTQSSPHDLGERAEQLALELEALRRGLDHQVAGGQVAEGGDGRRPSRRARASAAGSGSYRSVSSPAPAASAAMPPRPSCRRPRPRSSRQPSGDPLADRRLPASALAHAARRTAARCQGPPRRGRVATGASSSAARMTWAARTNPGVQIRLARRSKPSAMSRAARSTG